MKPDARQVQERIDHLVARCRDEGMAVTPQRIAIFRALVSSDDHPSPEMLHQRVKKTMPSLSLATIYKTLDALAEMGLVEEVSPVGDVKRYDGNHRPHHHLVCVKCKKVIDFYSDSFDAITPPRGMDGFVPQALTVQIKGTCARCDRSARK